MAGVACAAKDPAATLPNNEARTDAYARLIAGSRLTYAPMLTTLLWDDAQATFDSATAVGIDAIALNWRNIVVGAKVDAVTRHIASVKTPRAEMRRDSGSIVFRLRDSTAKLGFRDTSMTFVAGWFYNKGEWKILYDSIRGHP